MTSKTSGEKRGTGEKVIGEEDKTENIIEDAKKTVKSTKNKIYNPEITV